MTPRHAYLRGFGHGLLLGLALGGLIVAGAFDLGFFR